MINTTRNICAIHNQCLDFVKVFKIQYTLYEHAVNCRQQTSKD